MDNIQFGHFIFVTFSMVFLLSNFIVSGGIEGAELDGGVPFKETRHKRQNHYYPGPGTKACELLIGK